MQVQEGMMISTTELTMEKSQLIKAFKFAAVRYGERVKSMKRQTES